MDDLRIRLEAVRDRLELVITNETDGSKLAAASREYRQVLDTLQGLAPPAAQSKVDELAERRTGRNTVTADPSRTAKHRKSAGG